MENETQIKQQVKEYWNNETCGTWASQKQKFTVDYYNEIEADRYKINSYQWPESIIKSSFVVADFIK